MENYAVNLGNLVVEIDNSSTSDYISNNFTESSGVEQSDMGIARFEHHSKRPSPSLENLFSNRDVLAKRLKNRPPKDDLIDRHIIPAHTAAPGIYDKVTLLERKKTGDYLQKKIRARPSRQQLIQRHILSDHRVDPSLLDSLGKLERQRIADHLNEHLLARPGPIELIQDRILPVESPIQNVVENVEFETALSPTSSTTETSPVSDLEGGLNTLNFTSPSPPTQNDPFSESFRRHINQTQQDLTTKELKTKLSRHVSSEPNISKLTISQNFNLSQKENEKLVRSVNKKSKQSKTKVKKLKFHECRPPDMPVEAPVDSPVDERYRHLLEQQTLYLRLQVMQQNAMLNALQGNTESMEAVTEELENVVNKEKKASEVVSVKSLEGKKLDDLRVIDLRAQLKQRGLLVSGSKAKLIERLVAYEEGNALPTDFSYSSGLSEHQKIVSSSSNSSDVQPATTMMQVTTYATDATGQTYQVVQAVMPHHNVMQYQVIPSDTMSRPAMSPIHMEQVNIQPVVAVTQPHVMTLQEAVSDIKQEDIASIQASQSSQMQFHLTPPPQQASPTIVLHQGPTVQRAALLQHNRPKVEIQQMAGYDQQYFSQHSQNPHQVTHLSQSLPDAQFSTNYLVNSELVRLTNSDSNNSNPSALRNIDSQMFRSRTSSEPASQFKRSQSYGDTQSQHRLLNGLDKNANFTQGSLSEKVKISGRAPTVSHPIIFDQRQHSSTQLDSTKSPEHYEDIMDILGEISTPSPTTMDGSLSSNQLKLEDLPSYNSCAYSSSSKQQQQQKNQLNKFLNVNTTNKQFSSVPENMNSLGSSPVVAQNFLSTPYGSLGGNSSLGGSMTNLQSQQSNSYGNLNQSSSTGNIHQLHHSDSCNSLSTDPQYNRNTNTPTSFLKMEYSQTMSPMSVENENLTMDLDTYQASQNNTMSWLDLNMESGSSPNQNFRGILNTKDMQSSGPGSYLNISNPNMIDMNSAMIPQNTLYSGNTRTQTSIYGSSPRPQDGFVSLYDLEGGDF